MTIPERLRRLDTCAASDACDRLRISGTVAGIQPMTGPVRIAGRVVTVKLGLAGERPPGRHLGTAAIEAARAGDVIVVQHRSRADCAGWGGLLSLAAKARDLSGTIVDGLVRDVDESRDAGYPVFARGAVPFTARGRVVEEGWNVPVVIGGVEVSPGDLVIADASGVVFLPASRVEEVVAIAEAIAARESAMAEALQRGMPVSRVMGGDYEKMLKDPPD